MTALALAGAELRRLLRDRTSLFFVVLLPVVIILLIGVTVGGIGKLHIAVVNGDDGPLARHLVSTLGRSSEITTRTDLTAAQASTALRRGELAAVVLLPASYDDRLDSGDDVTVAVLVEQTSSTAPAAMSAVNGAVGQETARLHAARFVGRFGVSFADGLRAADRAAVVVPAVTVHTSTVDTTSNFLPRGFASSAPTMLVLFVFINALAGGAAIIQSRRYGVLDRALAGPARARDLVLGETLSLFGLAALQAVLIIAIGAGLFGVSWGDPVAASALVAIWVLVGTGAGVLAGTMFRTPEQASSIGPAFGIAAGMLGGCMWPLEIVPPFMRTLGHLFPHAWAVDGWIELIARQGHLGDIVKQLAVLAAFAVVLLALATWRLQRRLIQ